MPLREQLDGLGSDDDREPRGPKGFFKRQKFWPFWAPLIFTLICLLIGILLHVYSPLQACSLTSALKRIGWQLQLLIKTICTASF